jgi:membrane associated rhomboid family serine protease
MEAGMYQRVYNFAGVLLLVGIFAFYVGSLWLAWETGEAFGLLMAGASTFIFAVVIAALVGCAEYHKDEIRKGNR